MSGHLIEAKRAILDQQLAWAGNRKGLNGGYFGDPKENMPFLTRVVEDQIRSGDGAEFGKEGKRGKICALHSSSALAVNFFAYWRGRDWSPLGEVLGIGRTAGDPRFEHKFPTGIGPKSPNLDVTLQGQSGLLAIESKFTEWLGTSGRKALREAYLPMGKGLWTSVGLVDAQSAAESYRSEAGFSQLDVPQLLKHLLGLATQRPEGGWKLLLLWYGPPSLAADRMKDEISRFRGILGADGSLFRDLTYQELWADLRPRLGSEHGGYRDYLDARYFPRDP